MQRLPILCSAVLLCVNAGGSEVVRVADYGAVADDGLCDREAVQSAIRDAACVQARTREPVTVELLAGVYNLREPALRVDGSQALGKHIEIRHASNVTVRGATTPSGQPATILERNVPELQNRMATAPLIYIAGGEDLTLENLVLDNNPRFSSAGACVKVDKANDAVEVRVFGSNPHFDGMNAYSANAWDLETRDLKPGVPHLSIGLSPQNFPERWRRVSGDEGRRYRIENMGFAQHLNVGDGVSWHFNLDSPTANMLLVRNTDGLTLQNLAITNEPAALVSMRNVADLTCRRVCLAPAGEQLAVGPRDGLYTAGSRGEYLYEDCVFSGVRWDPLPLFDKLAYIEEMVDSRTARMFWYRNETYDIEGVDALLWMDDASPVRTRIVSQHWEGPDRTSQGRRVIYRGTVTFADDVPTDFGAGSAFTPILRTRTTIRNCTFENNYGRSPYLSGVNMLIENNVFRNNGYAFALGISSPGAGGFVHDVRIRGNTFADSVWSSVSGEIPTSGAIRFYENQGYEFGSERYHSKVVIERNTFENVGLRPNYAAIDIRNARDFIIRGNTYVNTSKSVQLDPASTDGSSIRIAAE